MTRARYREAALRVDGWIDASVLDVVWTRSRASRAEDERDTLLRAGEIQLRDAPGGRVFATLREDDDDETRWVHTLARERGAALVRLDLDEASAALIGWVDERATQTPPRRPPPRLIGKGGGGGSWPVDEWSDWDTFPRGSLLVDEASRAVVGALSWDRSLECDGPCAGDIPRVWVTACGQRLRVRVVLAAERVE